MAGSRWRQSRRDPPSPELVCGITGQARFDDRPVSRDLLERMCRAVEHRGPDARGIHLERRVGLGIQRLRVIDLNTGDQPIFNEDGTIAVVLNGEIYNFQELRTRLERNGHRFRTAGDTEVIAHLYEEEGPNLVRSLCGMFAFAVWDRRQERLMLARDRVGKKPLHYSTRGEVITFASELNAVMADDQIPREVDDLALDSYLAYRWVPAPRTAFRAVSKLPPATTLIFDRAGARLQRYWRLDYGRKRGPVSAEDVAGELRAKLRAATQRRMVADVPVGAFLSGGIDSSAVVAAMAESSTRPVKTFSIGFVNDDYDELPQARLVAQRFATDHHEFVVEPNAVELLPRIVRHYGEPFADPSAIPSFLVAEMGSRHVTVALNGDGGDESFGGYTRYVANLALAKTDGLPLLVREAAGKLGGAVPASGKIDSARSRLRRALVTLPLGAGQRYAAYMANVNGLNRDRLYTAEYRERVRGSDATETLEAAWRRSSATALLDRMLDVDVNTYLPDDLLTKMDIATMAHSLEGRSPFLDHELMEFAASLPATTKVHGLEKKVGLREALRGWIPDQILDAPKRGFRIPLADWIRAELSEFVRDVLTDPATRGRGYFNDGYLDEILDRHQAGVEDRAQGIWTLLNFELWHREFIDRADP